MASLKHVIFARQPAPWGVGTAIDANDRDLYQDGARWSNPDSLVSPPIGGALITARIGRGQSLGLGTGGIYAAGPYVAPEEPEEP